MPKTTLTLKRVPKITLTLKIILKTTLTLKISQDMFVEPSFQASTSGYVEPRLLLGTQGGRIVCRGGGATTPLWVPTRRASPTYLDVDRMSRFKIVPKTTLIYFELL